MKRGTKIIKIDICGGYKKELLKLSLAQRKCVNHREGCAVVLAGPGSGKTRVITVRVMGLVSEGKRVITMSFNKAAALEMEGRAKALIGDCDEKTACFATIHSYCYRIIREFASINGIKAPAVIADDERTEVIKKLYLEITGEKRISDDELGALLSFISRKTSQEMSVVGGAEIENAAAIKVFDAYGKKKSEDRLIDFDDMIVDACEILSKNGEFCKSLAGRFDYLQVDEAQDLSEKQFEIIKLLGGENVFAVADDDQSIYGFRGAKPSLLFEFEKNTAGCRRYLLEENYRSKLSITAVASEFIKNNTVRFEKNIFTRNEQGENIVIKGFKSVGRQAEFTARKILECGRRGETVCVLYRNNISALCVIAALCGLCVGKNVQVPSVVIRGERILEKNFGSIKKVLQEIKRREDEEKDFIVKSPKSVLKELDKEKMVDFLMFSRALSGKRRFYINSVVESLETICKLAFDAEECFKIYDTVCRVTETGETNGGITFSTIHSAKGLEFDNVFMVDNIEGELPSNECDSWEVLEEERRLAYVAMTRAKKMLYILYPQKCGKSVLVKSRFIDETRRVMSA